ncbi:hypothetical protein CGCFRS4_v004125 [Colletotrichum fructicola]|nr:hypothetical protein CGCFRS4_v004125 [Colletotrichum fructicola]
MPYFIIAYRILTTIWAGSFDDDLCQPTGMLLAAIYLCFKSRPLAAWKLAYMSSCNLQLLTQRTMSGCYDKEHDDMLSRLCWTCFVVECDSLSEFHLPRTGIEMAIDRMNFPRLAAYSSRNFIRTSIHVLTKQTYYSWMLLQALLSHSVLIVAAVSCSSMKHMVPEWRGLLQLAVEAVKPWSTRCSSAEVILLILQTLRHKVGSCHELADAKARKCQHGGHSHDVSDLGPICGAPSSHLFVCEPDKFWPVCLSNRRQGCSKLEWLKLLPKVFARSPPAPAPKFSSSPPVQL